ncbi:MAG: toxin-antitoxin system YwqK family antitoxin [Helicobacteraceae bacterium]|jgi:antitoxin component YwqK of YwqJK toxin-antitoxin module|nr:toxin-antitoxin system YwqK family antitoxin [Helicobacteraceae bacterium]
MKRVLIAILLAAICQSADTNYKVYVVGETARFDKGKCLDMNGNLLPDKAEAQKLDEDDTALSTTIGTLCVDGEAIEERGYYESGELAYIAPLKNGKREGIATYFYKSGKLLNEAPFKNGVKDGITKTYYESGELYYVKPYKNGKIEGVATYFYESGKFKSEIPYKNDVIDGIFKGYDEDGKLKQEIAYKNGVKAR